MILWWYIKQNRIYFYIMADFFILVIFCLQKDTMIFHKKCLFNRFGNLNNGPWYWTRVKLIYRILALPFFKQEVQRFQRWVTCCSHIYMPQDVWPSFVILRSNVFVILDFCERQFRRRWRDTDRPFKFCGYTCGYNKYDRL